MNAFGLAPLILLFPLVGILFNALFGRSFVNANRSVGEKWSGWFASIMALFSLAIALLLMASLFANGFHAEQVVLFDWINIPSADFYIPWAIQVDTLSVTMMLVVTGVGSLIHIYAIGYMHGDENFSRFFTYMNLFLFFMLILVSGNNYLMLFVGWEGVGLCSFLLIGFWFAVTNEEGRAINADAARKAFVVNRIGDFGMILALILMFLTFASLEFNVVFESAVELFEAGEMVTIAGFELPFVSVLTAITALFLLGAAGKSAQIPLYVWLPDAMAGPTPVSALIHAATMVTAGVYLIVRSNVFYEIVRESGDLIFGLISSPDLVAYIGAFTALIAGLIAFTQWDIKKVLAYSTVSQLGFMVAAAGMGAYVAAMFHLTTHAFFKALLFLSSGSVIHGMEHGHHHLHDAHDHGDEHHDEEKFDPQDMRTMGGLRQRMKITFWVYMIGALALSGIAPLAGFWSKDEIQAHAYDNEFLPIFIILTIAAFCTAFYMGRQLKLVFFGEARHKAVKHAVESPPLMTIPLIILAFLSIFGGIENLPFFTEAAEEAAKATQRAEIQLALEHWLEYGIGAFELTEEGVVHLPHTPTVISPLVAGISLSLAVAGLLLAFFLVYRKRPETATDPDPLERTPIWWFAVLPLNTLYMKFLVPGFNWLAKWLADSVDWVFWHDFFHDRIIRDTFVGFANFAADVLDAKGVDGIVNGSARLTGRIAGVLRLVQTGFVRNYALILFLGVVAVVAYFVLMAG
jgi:NADH-quinone oxidoreductase subunit L